jgi:hypothetical protein
VVVGILLSIRPGLVVGQSTAGDIIGTDGAPRILQMALKVAW